MNEPKHTPGPWDVYDRRRLHSDNEGSTTIIAGDIWIACVHGSHVGPQSKEEVDANVSLFAAAPELLEALKKLYALVEGECPSLLDEDSGGDSRLDIEIRAAIAKAEGVTHETP